MVECNGTIMIPMLKRVCKTTHTHTHMHRVNTHTHTHSEHTHTHTHAQTHTYTHSPHAKLNTPTSAHEPKEYMQKQKLERERERERECVHGVLLVHSCRDTGSSHVCVSLQPQTGSHWLQTSQTHRRLQVEVSRCTSAVINLTCQTVARLQRAAWGRIGCLVVTATMRVLQLQLKMFGWLRQFCRCKVDLYAVPKLLPGVLTVAKVKLLFKSTRLRLQICVCG